MTNLIKKFDAYISRLDNVPELDMIHTTKKNWWGGLNRYTEFSVKIGGEGEKPSKVPNIDFYNAEEYYTNYFMDFCCDNRLNVKTFELCVHRHYDKKSKKYSNDRLFIYLTLEIKHR